MSGRHLIDRAIFDTTCRVSLDVDEQAKLDAFIRRNLLETIDEVFGEIENNLAAGDKVLRLENLELDLGEISGRQYRLELPIKLREKLLAALTGITRSAKLYPDADSALIDGHSAEGAQLFYFLRNGYLPWYSRGMDAARLEGLLLEILDTAPASLREFLQETAGRTSVLERLKRQFPEALSARVMQQMPPARAATGGRRADIGLLQSRLVSGLVSGDHAGIGAAWRILVADQARWLERTIRHYGQQQIVRRRLIAGLAPGQFDELLGLLEPAARDFVRMVIEQMEIFAAGEAGSAHGGARKAELREHTLAHLLIERGNRFVEASFLESLFRQFAITRDGDLQGLLQGFSRHLERSGPDTGLERILAGISDRIAARTGISTDRPAGRASAYERFERISAALSGNFASRRAAAGLRQDIRALAAERPWLLLRLFRELEAGRYDWRPALKAMPAGLLGELVHAFLSLNIRAGESTETSPMDDLLAAIRSNLDKAKDAQVYYARILDCLINGRMIDFDVILADRGVTDTAGTGSGGAVVEAGRTPAAAETLRGLPKMDEFALDRMLQCAELLTTAGIGAGLSLSLQELDALKWRFIGDYADFTGYLFGEKQFTLQFVNSLMQPLDPVARGEVRAALVAGLRRNSLRKTREMTERLIEFLTDDTENPDPASADGPRESGEEPAVLEDIHIANAGAVLLAPYLPRLFERLGLIEADEFVDREAAERAVHCVQFLVDENLSSPEYQLVLNKLLCGIGPGRPICRGIELRGDEKHQLEGLLEAVIGHWGALGNTTIDGLRESFLQRDGRLQRMAEGWHLSVEGRSFDLLLDALPWAYSTIRFAWMDRPIYVEWR